MTGPGFELSSLGLLANTLPTRPMSWFTYLIPVIQVNSISIIIVIFIVIFMDVAETLYDLFKILKRKY